VPLIHLARGVEVTKLQPHVLPFNFFPNIFLRTFFSDTFHLCSSLMLVTQFHAHKKHRHQELFAPGGLNNNVVKLSTQLQLVSRSIKVYGHIHSPVHHHIVVIKQFSTGNTLPCLTPLNSREVPRQNWTEYRALVQCNLPLISSWYISVFTVVNKYDG
jgi:hypothetical protein